jgi:hypothetical protein
MNQIFYRSLVKSRSTKVKGRIASIYIIKPLVTSKIKTLRDFKFEKIIITEF